MACGTLAVYSTACPDKSNAIANTVLKFLLSFGGDDMTICYVTAQISVSHSSHTADKVLATCLSNSQKTLLLLISAVIIFHFETELM